MAGAPFGLTATTADAVSATRSTAVMTSPRGTLGSSCDCAGPQVPTANAPSGCGSRASLITWSVGSRWAGPTKVRVTVGVAGARIGAAEISGTVGRSTVAAPVTSLRIGARLVTVSSNSGVSRKGWSLLPSGLRAAPFVAAPSGTTAPRPAIAASTVALPGAASCRYFGTNAAQVIGCGAVAVSPNSTVRSAGPTENEARPWDGGPGSPTPADSETEIVMVPIQTSMLMPALIAAYTVTSNQNGSKNTMPSPPTVRCTQ